MPFGNPFPFSFKGSKKPSYPVLRPGPSVIAPPGPGRPPAGTPAAWMTPASGPMVNTPAPMGPEGGPDATRPPPPPQPGLVPRSGPMGPAVPPPQRNGVPGAGGDNLTQSPDQMSGDPLEGLDEDSLEQIMRLGIFPEMNQGLDSQIAQAEGLRGRAMPEGRDSGRIYTAANPLEFGGELLKQYAAKRDLYGGPERLGGLIPAKEGLYQQRQKNLDETAAARAMFIKKLRGTPPSIGPARPGFGQVGMPSQEY